MNTYEYNVVDFPRMTPEELAQRLNAHGAAGWAVVGSDPMPNHWRVIFAKLSGG